MIIEYIWPGSEEDEKKTFHATNENNLKIHDISVESVRVFVLLHMYERV